MGPLLPPLASDPGNRLGGGDVCSDNVVLRAGARHPVLDELPALLLTLDAHVRETGGLQHFDHGFRGARPRDSAGERLLCAELVRELGGRDDVGHSEAATLAEDAERLRRGRECPRGEGQGRMGDGESLADGGFGGGRYKPHGRQPLCRVRG